MEKIFPYTKDFLSLSSVIIDSLKIAMCLLGQLLFQKSLICPKFLRLNSFIMECIKGVYHMLYLFSDLFSLYDRKSRGLTYLHNNNSEFHFGS